MIYWCPESVLFCWSFDVAGMRLKKNIYMFTAWRTSWWGIRAAWVLVSMHCYTIYRVSAAVQSEGTWLYLSRRALTSRPNISKQSWIGCLYLCILHIQDRMYQSAFKDSLWEGARNKTSECNLIYLEFILRSIHSHKRPLIVKALCWRTALVPQALRYLVILCRVNVTCKVLLSRR